MRTSGWKERNCCKRETTTDDLDMRHSVIGHTVWVHSCPAVINAPGDYSIQSFTAAEWVHSNSLKSRQYINHWWWWKIECCVSRSRNFDISNGRRPRRRPWCQQQNKVRLGTEETQENVATMSTMLERITIYRLLGRQKRKVTSSLNWDYWQHYGTKLETQWWGVISKTKLCTTP